MELNDEQKKYFNHVREKVIPLLQGKKNPKLEAPIANLMWNMKKALGEMPGEKLDIETYAQRTKYDFYLIKEALKPGEEGRSFAEEVIAKIDGFFGLKMAPEEVKTVLKDKAAQSKEKLDWDKSIVDLLKLLGLESSLAARKKYAEALGFPKEQIDKMPNVEFNVWLHGQIMNAVACNRGNVPKTLVA